MTTFVVYRSGLLKRQWRWRLKAANHKIIATSGEAYRNKGDCYAAIQLVKRSISSEIVEL